MKEKLVFFAVFAIVAMFAMAALQGCSPAGVSLNGTNWIVTEINGESMMLDYEPTMVFNTATDVGGNASCNSFFGTYKVDGDKLSFDSLGNTEMWCMDEGVMDQETLFLKSLLKSDTVSIEGEIMTIQLNDGGSIVLERMEDI